MTGKPAGFRVGYCPGAGKGPPPEVTDTRSPLTSPLGRFSGSSPKRGIRWRWWQRHRRRDERNNRQEGFLSSIHTSSRTHSCLSMPRAKNDKVSLTPRNGFEWRDKTGLKLYYDIYSTEDGKKNQIICDICGSAISMGAKCEIMTWMDQHRGSTTCNTEAERWAKANLGKERRLGTGFALSQLKRGDLQYRSSSVACGCLGLTIKC
ncbi:hypothetical protein BKA70DRAFT_1233371 [Coprinopsis sp. MPI-PUGE-AT-0042]|nr:hypothetical protein BKA70DRAFT_1233371 [Coprinopsis sp. MPI-PUGE-AT-0042]